MMTNNQSQQQNRQQGNNLLRRAANNTNSTNNPNQNNGPLSSRFGKNNNTANNNSQPPKPTWTITPLSYAGVKISYHGIGDPICRILGTPLDKSLSDATALADRLSECDELRQQLVAKLNEAWDMYDFQGAAIIHPVRKNIQDAFTSQIMPTVEAVQQGTEDNSNNNTSQLTSADTIKSTYETYRAIDALFVLNTLGRVRGSVLVEETPLALEAGFLNQSYICDDPRIVELALATGAIEETW